MDVSRSAELYDVEAFTPGFMEHLQRSITASQHTRAHWPSQLDVAYGDGPAEKLDIFLTETPNAPIVIYLHGGFWKASSKNDRAFPAEAFGPAGAIWISQEYPLAPAATLDDMVACTRRAVAWVHEHAARFGGDPSRIFLCGNSAGGHLVAMAAATDWAAKGLPADLIKGVTTLSGLFDLIPLTHTRANGWLHLDLAAAVRNSPMFHLPDLPCPLICAVGEAEPPEFIAQSATFAEVWRQKGHPSAYLPMPDLNHFSIVTELGNPQSPLTRAMFEQIGVAT